MVNTNATNFVNNYLPKYAFESDPTITWVTDSSLLPKMLWNDFKKRISINEVTFITNMNIPYQILGSNDANCNETSSWMVLCQHLSGGDHTELMVNYCQVPQACVGLFSNSFRCLGIRLFGPTITFDRRYLNLNLYNIRIWS